MQDAENQPLSESTLENSQKAEKLAEPEIESPHSLWFNHPTLGAIGRFLLFMFLVRIVFIPLVFAGIRPFRQAIESALGDIGEALLLGCVLLGTFIMAKLERRSFFDYGLRDRRAIPNLVNGIVVGFISLTLMLLGLRVARDFYFGPQHMHGSELLTAALLNIVGFALVALLEETAFRGYALYTLTDGIRFWPAAVIMSLLFAWEHVQNPGESKIGILAVFAFGIMLAFSIWRTGSLLWAVGFHFAWDYAETFIYGVPDSGFVSPQHLLSARFTGPAWITGGSVGPEGSCFIFLVLAVVTLVIHFAYPLPKFQEVLISQRSRAEHRRD